MIQTEGITKSFGSLQVLKGIDLTIGEGEIVAIVGPSGAGKTTLLHDPATDDLLVLANRGARIVLGMPRGFYPGYDREIHEIYVYEKVK